jgi:hypothetical protein
MSTRRSFPAGTAAVAAISGPNIPTWPTPTPHLDAQLLRLNAQPTDAWAQENHAWAVAEGEIDDDGPLTIRASEAGDVSEAIITRIENMPALTLDGLLVKLRAASWCRSGHAFSIWDLDQSQNPSRDIRLLASVIADLSSMGRA